MIITLTHSLIKNCRKEKMKKDHYKIKSTPTEIIIMKLNENDEYEHKETIKTEKVIALLDEGKWNDDDPFLISLIISAFLDSYKQCTDEERLIYLSWMVAIAFYLEVKSKSGWYALVQPDGKIIKSTLFKNKLEDIHIHYSLEQKFIAYNVVGYLIKKYGEKEGKKQAIRYYDAMLSDEGFLSEFGWKAIDNMYDHFIQKMQNEMPMPTIQ